MIIWAYNLPRYLSLELMTKFTNVRFVESSEGIFNHLKPEDKIICMWDDGPTLSKLRKTTNETYPSREMIEFAASREDMTKFVDEHSQFPAERSYFKFLGEEMELPAPRFQNSLKVVAKVGEEHRGQDKFLLYPGQKIYVKDSVVFEEFVENAHSFRVLIVGEEVFIIDYFDDPYMPKPDGQHWIKNINAVLEENLDHEKYAKAIEDTKNMVKVLGWDYAGVDYVMNEEKMVCLEFNTFPGIRLNERTREAGLKYWTKIIHDLGGR